MTASNAHKSLPLGAAQRRSAASSSSVVVFRRHHRDHRRQPQPLARPGPSCLDPRAPTEINLTNFRRCTHADIGRTPTKGSAERPRILRQNAHKVVSARYCSEVEPVSLYSRRAERMTLEALADTRVVVVNGAR